MQFFPLRPIWAGVRRLLTYSVVSRVAGISNANRGRHRDAK